MTQPMLPFQSHSATSKAAAVEAGRCGLAARARETVYAAISASGGQGMTDEEIARVTGLNPSTARPRRVELSAAGRVISSGARLTASGRMAQVWIVR